MKQKACIIIITLILTFGCSTRQTTPVISENNTICYPATNASQPSVNIILADEFLKSTKQPYFIGQRFPIADNEMVHMIANVDFIKKEKSRSHLFHIEWLNQDGTHLFTKEINYKLNDTTAILYSGINSGNRTAGKYKVRIYYFRVLIAEKDFFLVPEKDYTDSLIEHFGASIIFGERFNKKNNELINVDTCFYEGAKKWVNALVRFKNEPKFEGVQIKYKMEWIDPNDSIIYSKKIVKNENEELHTLRSAISVGHKMRLPGNYTVRVYLFEKCIVKNNFILRPEKKMEHLNIGTIPINLSVGKSRKNSQQVTLDSRIFVRKGEKMYASIDFSKAQIDPSKSLKLQWLNSEQEILFEKKLASSEFNNSLVVKSSITLRKHKLKSGTCMLRIIYRNRIVAETTFIVVK